MRRLLVILALIVHVGGIYARNSWYEKPLEIAAGEIVLDTIESGTTDMMIHVRLSNKHKSASEWSVVWNRTGNDNFVQARITMPETRYNDNLYPSAATIDVISKEDGVETPLLSSTIDIVEPFFSIKLLYDGFSARLYAGCTEKILIGEVPFENDEAGEVILRTSQPMLARRISVICNQGLTAPKSQYPTVESLEAELRGRKDPIEGKWQYLDREVDGNKASLGGKYTLAIIKNAEGDYQIVSIGGDAMDAKTVEPMQVKGWLSATKFHNNYDLVWYDANGQMLDDDNNAQLSDDGAILTLRFPVYKSQLRFTRQ